MPKIPKIEIHFTTGDTEKLIKELRDGKIDGLLGVNAMPAPDLMLRTLFSEKIFLVLKYGTLCENLDANTGELSLMDLASLNELIFVRNEEGSTLNKIIDNVLAQNNICLKTHAFISDYSVQLSLCKALGFAVFCPESLVFAEGGPAKDSELRVYRVHEITERMTISLVIDARRYYPKSAEAFFQSVKNIFHRS